MAGRDIFEKKNDKWQAITSQVTRVKKERNNLPVNRA